MKKIDLSFALLTAVILTGVLVALASPAPATSLVATSAVAAVTPPAPAGS